MKKVLFMILCLSLAGGIHAQSANNQAPQTKAPVNTIKPGYGKFVDKNNDGICDNFIDANKDGRCDNCVNPGGNCLNGLNRKSRQGQCPGMGQGNGRGAKGQRRANCMYNVTVSNQ